MTIDSGQPACWSCRAGMTTEQIGMTERSSFPQVPTLLGRVGNLNVRIMSDKLFAVYIMANERPTLYAGMCNNLLRRVWEHKRKLNPNSFTARYNLYKLVYYEFFNDVRLAIIKEKQIKNLSRVEKIELIKIANPTFRDLFDEVTGQIPEPSSLHSDEASKPE